MVSPTVGEGTRFVAFPVSRFPHCFVDKHDLKERTKEDSRNLLLNMKETLFFSSSSTGSSLVSFFFSRTVVNRNELFKDYRGKRKSREKNPFFFPRFHKKMSQDAQVLASPPAVSVSCFSIFVIYR